MNISIETNKVIKSLAQAWLDLSTIKEKTTSPESLQLCSEALVTITRAEEIVFKIKELEQ